MWQVAICSFLAGVFGANGVPHVVRGITKESYPCLFGNSPIPNVIAGWCSFVLAILLANYADPTAHSALAFSAGAVGALLMGLFQAAGLAFGRRA